MTAFGIVSMHVTGSCLTALKECIPVGIGVNDCDHCQCRSALKKMIGRSKTGEDRAEASRCLAKLLVFMNRALEALPFATEAYHFYREKYGKMSIDAFVMRAELVFIYAMIGDETYSRLATKLWFALRDKVSDFQNFPVSDRPNAIFLLKHMGCDELLAKAYHEGDKDKKIEYLTTALKIAIDIKHGFLTRICADLDVLGCVFPDTISFK